MHLHIIFCVSIVLSFVSRSGQQIHKQPLRDQPPYDLDYNFLKVSERRLSCSGGDANLCDCAGATPESVRTVKYLGSQTLELVLCTCPNAATDARYMINTLSKVPHAIRTSLKIMSSAEESSCATALTTGDSSTYWKKNQPLYVYIHESAHAFDQGKSESQEWRDAVERDSCVLDEYANTNSLENFANVLSLWVYLVGTNRDQDFGEDEFACMKNQLELMARYLPGGSIKT